MSKVNISKYQTPGFGSFYYEDRVVVNPSQNHGSSGGGGTIPQPPTQQNNPVENEVTILPDDIAAEQILDIEVIPESDSSDAE